MDKNYSKALSGLPQWAKGVIAVAIIGGIAFVGYTVIKGVQGRRKTSGSRKEDQAVKDELDKLITSGKGPTLNSATMLQSANQLFQSMDGYGTNEAQILGIFGKVKNDADVFGIIQSYGIRELSSGKFNPEPNLKSTLGEALTSELSSSWINALNSILTKKGIKHKF